MIIQLVNASPYLIGGNINGNICIMFKKINPTKTVQHFLNLYIYVRDPSRELTSKDPRSELGYRLTVQVDQHDPARPLAVVHIPSLGSKVK